MTFGPLFSLGLPLVAAALLVGLALWRRRRNARVLLAADQKIDAGFRATEERLSNLIADLDLRHGNALDNLTVSMNALCNGVEWLAGDRMIEQAIAMAQSGAQAESISSEMGLSLDDSRTIMHFRRH